jgi:hypothetical protein
LQPVQGVIAEKPLHRIPGAQTRGNRGTHLHRETIRTLANH